MIAVTDLHGIRIYVNAELIELIEENPETQLVMTTGKRVYVKENAKELVERILAYKRNCMVAGPEVYRRTDEEDAE